jgi:hypothetical protein
MIVAQRKTVPALMEILQGHRKLLVLNASAIMSSWSRLPNQSKETMPYFPWAVGRAFRPWPNGTPKNQFMPDLIQPFWAFWKKGESGPRNAPPVVPVYYMILAVFVLSLAAPNTCSTAHAAVHARSDAKSDQTAIAPGN